MGRSLVLSAKLNKKIDESTSFDLKVPEDATRKGVGDGAAFSWSEPVIITDSSIGAAKYNPKTDSIKVMFRIPADAESVNAGRSGTWWFNVNKEALDDDKDDEHMTSFLNLGRMRELARAAGFELGEGDDLYAVFEPAGEGEQSPIAGASVIAKITDKPKKNRETKEYDGRRQDPIKFYPGA